MHKPFIPLPLVIVAGGKSSRMGSDKALLPFGGFSTLSEFQLARLKPYFKSIYISVKSYLKCPFDASFIEDDTRFGDAYSPLVAMLSILEYFQIPVCILSVDTPFVTPEVFETLFAQLDENTDALVATSQSHSHQLCAIYTPSIIPIIRTMIEKDEHKIRAMLAQCRTKYVSFEEEELFFNLNHPEEYELAKKKYPH